MAKIKAFIDSDVVIFSLLSSTGASNAVIQDYYSRLKLIVSDISFEELVRTADKLGIIMSKLEEVIKKKLKIIKLRHEKKEILNQYGNYAYDAEDAHIIAGVVEAKSKFLVTFNTKDYKIEKIYHDFGIRVIIPGEFLQYLRSLQ